MNEEDYIQISGLQHYIVCKRSWALIYLEDLWLDNWRTISGNIMHERVHDSSFIEKRGSKLSARALKIYSKQLGIVGETDLVEFIKDPKGVYIKGYPEKYIPYPVEYKRGSGKALLADSIQLCAQAMCLEEMLNCCISKGALFYGELHRRTEVLFTDELRIQVKTIISEIREIIKTNKTPKAVKTGYCRECSLKEQCLPKGINNDVSKYLKKFLKEDIDA